MAITNRKGLSSALVKSKLLPGELAVTTDTGELYYCYSAGNVKNVATLEDVQKLLDASNESYAALISLIAELEADAALSASILSDLAYLKTGIIGTDYPTATYANQLFYKII